MEQLQMRRPHLRDLPPAAPLPPGYALRAYAGPVDLPSLGETLGRAFDNPWPVERLRASLTEAPDVRAVYVATYAGRVVATASSRGLPLRFPDTGYVHWVATHPDHTRRGLASALLGRVLADFAARGETAAVLETDDARLPALKTYLKYGFLPVYEVAGAEGNDEDHRARWTAVFQALFGGRIETLPP